MNGKHPIDDLFARTLRDAEAQPPPAVWEGIVRKRDLGHTAILRLRRNWGYAALLLLLLGGAAGYWAATSTGEPTNVVTSQYEAAQATDQAVGSKSVATTPPVPKGASSDTAKEPGTMNANDDTDRSPSQPAQEVRTSTTEVTPTQPKTTAANNASASTGAASRKKAAKAHDSGTTTNVSVTTSDRRGTTREKASSVQPAGVPTLAPAKGTGAAARSGTDLPKASAGNAQTPRISPDFNLPRLTSTAAVLNTSAVLPPGPMLHGDSTTPYVLARHNWWIAGQLEWAAIDGEWKGTGTEVQALNESENWKEGREIRIAGGLQWQSGWSAGLGVGLSQQRSRFLRRVVQPGNTDVVVDTTWVGSPQGQVTNYTWDIVETLISEPGTEQEYNATNTYTHLRIAPEVGYRILEQKRWSLDARFSPVLITTLGRKGSTLVATTVADSLDTTGPALAVVPLDDAAVDERFPVTFALSGGLDLRYRICDHWSVGVLPTFTHWLSGPGDHVPVLSMNELGGALRLRYDFRHHERRTK